MNICSIIYLLICIMIIWSGRGILVPLIAIAGFAISGLISSETGLDYLMPLGIWAAAISLWFLGVSFEKKPGKIMIDPETNQRVEMKKRHTFFWIPIKWRGIILGVISLPMAVGVIMMLFQHA